MAVVCACIATGLPIAKTVLLHVGKRTVGLACKFSPCGVMLSFATLTGRPSASTIGAPGPITIPPGPHIDIPTLPIPNILLFIENTNSKHKI